MSSLSDRLKSLGVKVGAQDLPRPTRQTYPIDQVVDGRFLATRFGETFTVEALYPPEYRHGQMALSVTASLQMIAEWGRTNHLAECDPNGFMFLDTETTGLSGGTGTYAFLVGVGHFSPTGFQLSQFFMRDPAEEPAMLAALTDYLDPCQALVTYNGKAFDAPLLNTRYTLQGFTPPLPNLAHLDLLPLARRLWRDRLPSRTLSYIETNVLGANRTQEEVPGWMIPQMYFDYLRSADARPLRGVLYHNAMDILALAALFCRTVEMLARPLE
ncbi:MAG TPA: ribonuclease H-like domain-containing protein, partial [Anaerolineaceae bacterium]|nr:ribonuclease H-like domain-containing protein [Anaerolineaceae bacterium]